MSSVIELRVPDIGDFSDVPVIEVLVKPGDTVGMDDPLVTLESDKATMEVPASAAGTIEEVRVKLGDKVSAGRVLATLRPGSAPGASSGDKASAEVGRDKLAASSGASAKNSPATEQSPTAKQSPCAAPEPCDLLVLGGGPGGYSAAFRAADLGLSVVLVERYPTLGGVCLNVGCIPSKALLHVAGALEESQKLAAAGVRLGAPEFDLDRLRAHKEAIVAKLTGGLAGLAKARKVERWQGVGRFLDPHRLEVAQPDGSAREVAFRQAIIAVGSRAIRLPGFPDDPRIVDSTGALALPFVPKKMLIVGGGIIGLEMATVYSALGARLTVVELGETLMPGADRDLVKAWEKENAPRFDRILLKTGVASGKATPGGIVVTYDNGETASFDLVLVAAGRAPNGGSIGAERAGVAVSARGFIDVDRQQRTNVPHIFAIGDVVGNPMLAHKAVHEGHVAAEVAAGGKSAFDALQIPGVAYTHPEIAWAGQSETALQAAGTPYKKAVFPWAASGRALANGAGNGMTKLLFDPETHRLLGGGIVGQSAGDLIGELCLAVEMGADAVDIGQTIHPHPTLCESIGMAAEVAEGTCTDLPRQESGSRRAD